MAFESIIHKPMPESLLLEQVISELQVNFEEYSTQSYFIKLAKESPGKSQIIWTKSFSTGELLWDFIFDTVYERTCILIKFHKGQAKVLCLGHKINISCDVWKQNVKKGHLDEASDNPEKYKMIPRDLLEKGFGEIQADLSLTKCPKAV